MATIRSSRSNDSDNDNIVARNNIIVQLLRNELESLLQRANNVEKIMEMDTALAVAAGRRPRDDVGVLDSNDYDNNGNGNDEEERLPPRKRTCRRSSEEPDVTIVVGDAVFQEYSQSLRCWSDYFDRGLASGMKESTTMKFEFPHRDPSEWELVVSLMMPLSTHRVTMDNFFQVLPWFDELCSPCGMAECDRVLAAELNAMLEVDFSTMSSYQLASSMTGGRGDMETLFSGMELALRYNLQQSKTAGFSVIGLLLKTSKARACLAKAQLQKITEWIKDISECHLEWWEGINAVLPASISEAQKQALVEHNLLHEFLDALTRKPHSNAADGGDHSGDATRRRYARRTSSARERVGVGVVDLELPEPLQRRLLLEREREARDREERDRERRAREERSLQRLFAARMAARRGAGANPVIELHDE